MKNIGKDKENNDAFRDRGKIHHDAFWDSAKIHHIKLKYSYDEFSLCPKNVPKM